MKKYFVEYPFVNYTKSVVGLIVCLLGFAGASLLTYSISEQLSHSWAGVSLFITMSVISVVSIIVASMDLARAYDRMKSYRGKYSWQNKLS
jgi:uncharacterized membrane protein